MDALLLLKASLLLSVVLVATRLLRRASATSHHRLWTLAFAALLALPFLALVLPVFYIPVPAAWRASTVVPASHQSVGSEPGSQPHSPAAIFGVRTRTDLLRDTTAFAPPIADSGTKTSQTPSSRGARPTIAAVLLTAWSIGSLAAAGALLLSLLAVRRLTRTAIDLDDEEWRHAADDLSARLGLRRAARLLLSDEVRTPMAGGFRTPIVFLPASARTWTPERRDVVLAHELAHLAGRDPLRHVAARLAVAVYWFHPLAWIAARQSSMAREQACDETVLALGTRPSAYAQVLLDLADALQPAVPAGIGGGALPMVERSLLEARLMAILNHDVRPATSRLRPMPAIALAVLTLCVAAARPSAQPTTPNVTLGAATSASVATSIGAGPSTGAGAAISTPASVRLASRTIDAGPMRASGLEQTTVNRDSACAWDLSSGSSFTGSMSTTQSGGRTIINQQIGTRGGDRVIQQRFGDLRVCMLADGIGPADKVERPSQWIGRGRRVVMETRRGDVVQQLEIEAQSGGSQRTTWKVGGSERPFDAAAQQWRDRMLAALDTSWELSSLRGDVSSLRGDISSIRGDESSLRGEISSLRGEVSSMRGRASSVRGDESSLEGEISSLNGELSSLRGAISSEQGEISSLTAGRYDASDAERARIAASVKKHEAEIARLEQEVRDFNVAAKTAAVDKQIKALDADGKIAAIDAEIQAFNLNGKVAAVEAQIAALDVDGKTAAIERQITALDADRRGRQLEERRDAELKQLDAAIRAIR